MIDTVAANQGTEPVWHALTTDEALAALGVDAGPGLATAEAEARRARLGPNQLAAAAVEPRWRAFLRQYRDLMQVVLLVAGIVSLFLPHQLETAIVLIGITLLNAAMGLSQEGKASASVAALRKMMVAKAKVRRGGELVVIPMEEVVAGDIIAIEAGDIVPADGRILTAATLEIDESALTGESSPVPKQTAAVAADAGLGDRVDMAFMNTQVTRGAGTLVATAIGMATQVGHISGLLEAATDEKTPLTVQLEKLTRQLLVIAGLALVASIVIGLARDVAFETLFLTAVAFSVSAIPSELPAVVTAILSKGTQELAAAGAIVKRLRSVETLGSTSAINSDKTGTLTLNQMTAVQMATVGRRYTISGEGYSTIGTIAHAEGSPTSRSSGTCCRWSCAPMPRCAMASSSATRRKAPSSSSRPRAASIPTLTRDLYPRVATLPFDADYKLMATFHRMTDERGRDVIRGYVKGAPDQLLARAAGAHGPDGADVPIDQGRDAYLAENERLGSRACASWRRASGTSTRRRSTRMPTCCRSSTASRCSRWSGIVDPPRPEAKDAIARGARQRASRSG